MGIRVYRSKWGWSWGSERAIETRCVTERERVSKREREYERVVERRGERKMFSLMLCVFYSKPFSSFLRLDVESLLPIITAAAASWAALGRMILPDVFRGDADCCWWQYISLEVAAQKQRKINNWEMKLNLDGREIMDRWGFRPCPHMWAIFPLRDVFSIWRYFLTSSRRLSGIQTNDLDIVGGTIYQLRYNRWFYPPTYLGMHHLPT